MATLDEIRRASEAKLARLKDLLRALDGALVAFSGGVDSAFVLAVAREMLGARAVALTAHSPSVPQAERSEARALAERLGARHVVVESREMDDPRYVANGTDRCYYCKAELYRLCEEVARREGLGAILDGFNADDRRDHRPGHVAAAERAVRSPLAEAGLGKDEVRAWSEARRRCARSGCASIACGTTATSAAWRSRPTRWSSRSRGAARSPRRCAA